MLLAALAAGLALAAVRPARAIQLSAVYDAACQRQVGVILHVDRASIRLLTLSGEVRRFDRFEIIYLAHYPVGVLPAPGIADPGDLPLVVVRTRDGDEIVELARGWLIDHSDVEMSFLGVDGLEVVIRVDDIWDIALLPQPGPVSFPGSREAYRFEHPYPFRLCDPDGPEGAGEPRTVYPQELLADPVRIKRELDHLQAGHERVADFVESQVFYPVPGLYGNETRLGMWANAGSRHGVSRTRTSSVTPALTSELSEGPFGFQRVLVAGAAPMPYSVHEEVQTQFYYRLKADYVHFSANFDISRLLIGERRYKWRAGELDTRDERWNEISHLAGGFDYGRFAGDLSLTSVQYAFSRRERFFTERADMVKWAGSYRDRHLSVELMYGLAFDKKPGVEDLAESSSQEDIDEAEAELAKIPDFHTDLRLYRLNIGLGGEQADDFRYSLIYRTSDFRREADDKGRGEFRYRGATWVNAVWWRTGIAEDLTLTLMAALEDRTNRAGVEALGAKTRRLFPKAGLGIALKL